MLDNVSESELLGPAQLATLPGGMGANWLRIVATSRLDLKKQKDRLEILPVESLDEESALTLIRDHQPPRDVQGRIVADLDRGDPQFASPEEESAAREIVRALGGFTLAVEQVALYLGLHPEVSPSAFLATLQARGLPLADTLPDRDKEVAAQMLTQSKQLGLILDSTLSRLDTAARTALQFAALLPADSVPWPWLRALTVGRHPELGASDDLGADPWLAIQRRLTGLRLLTSGDQPEIARIHRLVAAHLQSRGTGFQPVMNSLPDDLIQFLCRRADEIYQAQYIPAAWELDALLVALPPMMKSELPAHRQRDIAIYALFLTDKVMASRNLSAAVSLVNECHQTMQRLADSDPANAAWQRDLSVSFNKLGDLATARGTLPEAQRLFGEQLRIAQRLAESDPANAAWQRDLAVSHHKLAMFANASGDETGAVTERRECFLVLRRMQQRGLHFDPRLAQVFQ